MISAQSNPQHFPSNQWAPDTSQVYPTLGATALTQDNPPTYDASMAAGIGSSGGWTQPS